jgi:hypothetical protein
MALHWAWSFDVRGTNQQYSDAGWSVGGGQMISAFARHPLVGFGGADYSVLRNSSTHFYVTPAFPKGALADGKFKFHVYATSWSTGQYFSLLDSTGTKTLLAIYPSVASGVSSTFDVYAQEGGALVLRGTTTGVLNTNTWHTIEIRFKPAGAAGEIQISLNEGTPETIVAAGAVGATSPWARFATNGLNGVNTYTNMLTAWDSAADTTTNRWVATLRPVSDVAVGSYLNELGSGVNVYQSVDEAVPSTADYATSTTALDTIKFGVATSNIDPTWAPTTIDGVSVVCMARGELALNSAHPVLGKAASSDVLGTVQTTDANSSFGVNDVFTVQADASAWSVAGLNAGQYGMRTT